MRGLYAVFVVAGLVACGPTVPDSGAGVGFDDYDTYLSQKQARDAELRAQRSGRQTTAPKPVTPEQQTASDAVAAVRGSSGQQTRGESVPAGIQNTSPNAPVPDLTNRTYRRSPAVKALKATPSAARRKARNTKLSRRRPFPAVRAVAHQHRSSLPCKPAIPLARRFIAALYSPRAKPPKRVQASALSSWRKMPF